MRRELALLVLVLCACGSLRKPPDPSRRLEVNTAGSLFEGSNGYVFAVLPDQRSPFVRVDVRYPVGSAHDPEGKEGLAHLVEHLLFEIEIERASGKTSISAEIARLALSSNAQTTKDFTHYQVQAPPEVLPELFRLEVERLAVGCKGISQAIFEREREVVLNELRERRGPDGGDLVRALNEIYYPEGHPYRGMASLESLRSLTLDDVCSFISDQYQRGKALVLVTGQASDEAVRQAAGQYFARLGARQVTHSLPVAAAPVKAEKVVLEADVEDPMVAVAWPLPAANTREYRLLQMVRSDMESRLNAFARTYGWGHGADAFIQGGKHAPYLVLTVALSSSDQADEAFASVEKAVEHAFRSLYKGGEKSDSERWQLRRGGFSEGLIAAYERPSGRASMYADFLQFDADRSFLVGRLEELRDTTPKQARDNAEKWLSMGRAKRILIKKRKGSLAKHSLRSLFEPGHSKTYGVSIDPAEADRDLAVSGSDRLAIEVQRYKLANGLSVVLWPHGEMPVVHSRLVVHSGMAREPKGAEGVASLTGMDDIYEDSMVYWQRSLSNFVDYQIRDVGWELRSPGREISEETKRFIKGRLKRDSAVERTRFVTERLAVIYGSNHPYARPAMTPKSIDRIGRDKLMDWAKKHIAPKNSTLIVAGKFDVNLVKKHIAYNMEHVDSGSSSAPVDTTAETQAPAWIAGFDRPDAPTVTLSASFLGAHGMDQSYGARLVLVSMLNAELASMREELAVSYGFHASYSPRKGGGLWTIDGDVDAGRAEEAAAFLQRLILALAENPKRYRASFVLARRKVVDSLLSSANDSRAIADRLEYMTRFDLSDRYYQVLVENIARLRLEDIERLVKAELQPSREVLSAWGPKDAVEKSIQAARTARVVEPTSD